MTLEITTAQLAITDGVWQDNPETLAVFDAGVTRGTLYIATEVIGDTPERDQLARQMIETAQKNYAGTRGSITLALVESVRAVNEFFYQRNLNVARENRCIGGITIAALRDEHCFLAQGGPGLVLHARGNTLKKFPATSPWFSSEQFVGDFPTPGAVPIGLRRDYTPDLSHMHLTSGDAIFVATRALVQLFSDDEISDAMIAVIESGSKHVLHKNRKVF